jgi:hypothetical protein
MRALFMLAALLIGLARAADGRRQGMSIALKKVVEI